jgi:O-methyltransferase involved in polyketide biosynthesis
MGQPPQTDGAAPPTIGLKILAFHDILLDGSGPGWLSGKAMFQCFVTAAGSEILNMVSRLGADEPGDWMRADPDPPALPDIDFTTAHPARIWDYYLGGKDNFPADREVARQVIETMPTMPALARAVRRYQGYAVRSLLERGVRQFLDIGTGLPAAGSLHEIAQRAAPESQIVYVDNDPLVVAHARALLTSSQGSCSYVQEDLREPGKILAAAARTLDFTKPTAILLLGVLHFITDDEDPWNVVARLAEAITGDLYLVIAHGTADFNPRQLSTAETQYNEDKRAAATISMRDHQAVMRFFDGMTMLEPGLVPVSQWLREEDPTADTVPDLAGYVGTAWRPQHR